MQKKVGFNVTLLNFFTYNSKRVKKMTKHNETCKMAFGKLSTHANCERCNELKNGSQARSWSSLKYSANVSVSPYCYNVSNKYSVCTIDSNPSCNCGKMSFTD